MKKTIISLILAILTPLFVFAAIPDLYMSQVGFNGNIENTSGSVKIIAKAGSSYTLVNGNISDVDVSGTGSVIFSQCNITGFIKLSGTTQVSFINCNITGSDANNKYLIDIAGMLQGSSFSMINTVFSDPANVTIYGSYTSANMTITGSADRLCGNQSYPIKTINLQYARSTSLRMNQYVYVRTLNLAGTNNTLAGQMATDPNYSWNNWNVLGNASEGGIILDNSEAVAININNTRIKSISLKNSSSCESVSITGGTNLLNVDASNCNITSAVINMNSGSSATLNLSNNKLGVGSQTSGRWIEASFPVEIMYSEPVSETRPAPSAGASYSVYSDIQGPVVLGLVCETCGGAGKLETGSHQETVIHYKAEVEACADGNGNILWVEKNAQGQAVGTVAILKGYADQNSIPVTPLLPGYALEKNIEYDHTTLFAEPYEVEETVIDYQTCPTCNGAGGEGIPKWTATCTTYSYVTGGSLTINGHAIKTSYYDTRKGNGSFDLTNNMNGTNMHIKLNNNDICYTFRLEPAIYYSTHQESISCYFGDVPYGATVLEVSSATPPHDDYSFILPGDANYGIECYVSLNGNAITLPKEDYWEGGYFTAEKAPAGNGSVTIYRRVWTLHMENNKQNCREVVVKIYPYGK